MLAIGLLLIAAGACARPTSSGSSNDFGMGPDVARSEGVDCASNGDYAASPPALTALPTEAVLMSATRCLFEPKLVSGDGEWLIRTDQRADHGLDALAAALRLPSQTAGPGQACPAIGYVPIIITVTDTTGHQLHPRLPTEACGAPLPAAVDAIDALPWHTTATSKVRQTRSQLEVTSGCPGEFKSIVALMGAESPPTSPDAFAVESMSPPLRVCVYRPNATETMPSGALTFHIGRLAAASTLVGATAHTLLATVAAAPPASAACTTEAPFAEITSSNGEIFVELGGCYRALIGNTLRQLNADAVNAWHLL
jgi:hypothetical protein